MKYSHAYVGLFLSGCMAIFSLFKLSSNARVCRSRSSLVGALQEDKIKCLYHQQASLLRFPFIRHRCFQWHMTRTSKIRHNCSLIMTKQTCQLTITVPYRSRLPSRSYLF